MEKITQDIGGYPVKNWCVMCEQPMELSLANYMVRGNFCQPCNAKCKGIGIKVKEFRKTLNTAFF